MESGRPKYAVASGPSEGPDAQFTPDGRYLLTTGGRAIRWWKAEDGEPVREWPANKGGDGGASDANRYNIFSGYLGYLSCNNGSGFGFDYRDESGILHPLLCAPGLPANQWVHVAVTRTGDLYTLYLNGQYYASTVDSNPNLPTWTGAWDIGRRNGFMFQGLLDEVEMFDRALDASEVLLRYENSLGGVGCAGRTPIAEDFSDTFDGTSLDTTAWQISFPLGSSTVVQNAALALSEASCS